MNIFAKFDENPAITLQVIKKTNRYGRTHGQRKSSIPHHKQSLRGGIINVGAFPRHTSDFSTIEIQCSKLPNRWHPDSTVRCQIFEDIFKRMNLLKYM